MPGDWPGGAEGFGSFEAPTASQKRAIAAVWSWTVGVTAGERRGLVLWGGFGAGKTHLARAADRTLLASGWVGNFYDSPAWVKRIQSFYGVKAEPDAQDRSFSDWLGRPYFILDDLGTEHVRAESLGWLQECLFLLVNGAERTGLSLLITTNLPPAVVAPDGAVTSRPLADRVGGKVWSRLAGLCGADGFVDLSGVTDYRLRGPNTCTAPTRTPASPVENLRSGTPSASDPQAP